MVTSLNEIVSFTAVNNKASRRVIEKIGLHYYPRDDFDHPKLEKTNPLSRHVLYRLTKGKYLQLNRIKNEEVISLIFSEAGSTSLMK